MTVRLSHRTIWAVLAFLLGSLLWILNVELTYRSNVHRGLPANFDLEHRHTVSRWKA